MLRFFCFQALGHDISKLCISRDLGKDEVIVHDGLVGEVLAVVNVLGTLAATDYVVSTLDACTVFLIDDRGRALLKTHVLEEILHVDDLLDVVGCSHVLSLCR